MANHSLLLARPLIGTDDHVRQRGFTLAELLVVIGIILLLISILIPMVAKVREAGQATNTRALISAIDGACQAYYQDHRTWPGLFSRSSIGIGNQPRDPDGNAVEVFSTDSSFAGIGDELGDVTGTENLVLSLLGGIIPAPAGSAVGSTVVYDPSKIGAGAVRLGSAPGSHSAYLDARPQHLSMRNSVAGKTGKFIDDSAAADDSIIPEFVDLFSNPLPILYLRAQPSGFNGGSFSQHDIVGSKRSPYNYFDIAGYVAGNNGYIGVGKKIAGMFVDGQPYDPGVIEHGFRPWGIDDSDTHAGLRRSLDTGSANYTYPYHLTAALTSPSAAEARQKDRYIIITAGADRTYGTRDDLTNFGAY